MKRFRRCKSTETMEYSSEVIKSDISQVGELHKFKFKEPDSINLN